MTKADDRLVNEAFNAWLGVVTGLGTIQERVFRAVIEPAKREVQTVVPYRYDVPSVRVEQPTRVGCSALTRAADPKDPKDEGTVIPVHEIGVFPQLLTAEVDTVVTVSVAADRDYPSGMYTGYLTSASDDPLPTPPQSNALSFPVNLHLTPVNETDSA